MEPRSLLLALASNTSRQSQENFPLDRIRIQKAVFLATMRGAPDWKALFDFEPYNWGPYSNDLTREIGTLCAEGLLTTEPSSDRYTSFRLTPLGEDEATEVFGSLPANESAFIKSVREFVTSRSFNRLLKDVYAAYPEFAVNSRFSG